MVHETMSPPDRLGNAGTSSNEIAPRSGRYALAGLALGLAAPLGFLAVDWLLGRRRHRTTSHGRAYAYMGLTTPVVFAVFGHTLAKRQDRQRILFAEIERLREEFASVVAHDLRSPIQAILLQSEYLLGREGGGDEVTAEALRGIRRNAERLARMVRDLLDASRLEAGRLSLDRKALSVPGAIATLVDSLRPTLGAHPIDVRVEGTCPPAFADPDRLDQMLTNLIDNAAKYSPEGAPIVVRIQPRDGFLEVAVEDRGPGISSEDIPRLFDRFYQSQRARARKTGLGLGLYITRGLAEAHGGHVEVETTLGRGSTFRLRLPARPGMPPDDKVTRTGSGAADGSASKTPAG